MAAGSAPSFGQSWCCRPRFYLGVTMEFWDRVRLEDNDCWVWTGCRWGVSGRLQVSGRRIRAHRHSWNLFFGEIPAGLVVRHRCDNPLCVNPEHLELGTQLDNIRDRQERQRQARGTRNARAKLTEAQVRDIRTSRALGESQKSIAARLGVSPNHVGDVWCGRKWAHLV